MKIYYVSRDYSPITGLRYCKKTSHSGEDFYHKKLNGWFAEAFQNKEELTIVLDGGEDGYGPSFLDESFGNLIYDFSRDVVERLLHIDSTEDPEWGESVYEETFPVWEESRKAGVEPEKTEEHEPWYKLVGDKLELKVWVHKSE